MEYPEKIQDLNTGFNKVYQKVLQGKTDRLDHTDLFKNDPESLCPIYKDARLRLGDTQLLAIEVPAVNTETVGRDIKTDLRLASMELDVARYEDEYTAYGPALTKNIVPGLSGRGSVYYMDVTHMSTGELFGLQKEIQSICEHHNRTLMDGREPESAKQLADQLLNRCVSKGAASPILALGKAFDAAAKEYQQKLKKERQVEREKTRAKLKTQRYQERRAEKKEATEPKMQIFAKPGILTVPESDREDFSIRFKLNNDVYSIRIPRESEEVGKDGVPYVETKVIKNSYNYTGWTLISAGYQAKFTMYKNDWPIEKPVTLSQLRNLIEDKNRTTEVLERNQKCLRRMSDHRLSEPRGAAYER